MDPAERSAIDGEAIEREVPSLITPDADAEVERLGIGAVARARRELGDRDVLPGDRGDRHAREPDARDVGDLRAFELDLGAGLGHEAARDAAVTPDRGDAADGHVAERRAGAVDEDALLPYVRHGEPRPVDDDFVPLDRDPVSGERFA